MKEWDRHNIRMSLVQWEHGSERRAQSKLVQFYKKKKENRRCLSQHEWFLASNDLKSTLINILDPHKFLPKAFW